MKKIIIALGAALTIGMTHAATLNWALSGVTLPESTTAASGVSAYLFLTAASGNVLSYVDGASLTTIAAVENAIKGGTFTGTGAYVHQNLSTAGAATAATGVSTQFTTGDSLTGFAVIFDNADPASAENYMIAQNSAGVQELTATWGSAIGAQTLIFGSQSANGATWQAVPEPTSGLLLLLGMAGLALKRKRA